MTQATPGAWAELGVPRALFADLERLVAQARGLLGGPPADRRRPRELTVLFAGPPASGRTSAAAGVAAELGRPLFRPETDPLVGGDGGAAAAVVGVLEAADNTGAVVLVDAADVLLPSSTGGTGPVAYAAFAVRERLRRCLGLVIVEASSAEALHPLVAGEVGTTIRFG